MTPFSLPKFGIAVRVLGDTHEETLDIARDIRAAETAKGVPASLMTFTFAPGDVFVFSGNEHRMATDPPDWLEDQIAEDECDFEEAERRRLKHMDENHRALVADADTHDYRVLPPLDNIYDGEEND